MIRGYLFTSYLKLLIVYFWLIFLISSTPAQAEKIRENFVVKRADFNGQLNNTQNNKPRLIKEKFINKDDYYFLNTGEKKSFLREENAYFIIYKQKHVPSMTLGALQNRFKDKLDITEARRLKKLTKFKIKKNQNHKNVISTLYRADPAIRFISQVLSSQDEGGELAVMPTVIVSIDDKVDKDTAMVELQAHNLSLISGLRLSNAEFEMQVNKPVEDIGRIFELVRTVAELSFVKWAEPNFIASSKTQFIPDDPLFNNQWHLHNTGQNGAAVDADIDAPQGWDVSQGNGAVIAIYDDGVDTYHEDLHIWSNPGETGGGKESNGIDDDGNGYIDDYQGWDFNFYDNNSNPSLATDNHGTAVAGVAGALGNNNMGVSGANPGASILPVRMTSGSCADFANAMRYAGKYADVVNNSWTINACDSSLNAAISDVVNGNIAGARRGSLGTPVLFAAGNDASGWIKFILSGIPKGTYTFEWSYSKDWYLSAGYDTVWLDDITWPGGEVMNFSNDTVGNIPGGFASGGSAVWTVVSDGIHARGASGNAVKAGTIFDLQMTSLYITRSVKRGELTFWAWVSSEQDYDVFEFYINGILQFQYSPGQYGHFNDVAYPASNPDTIAVGASNDGVDSSEEERSHYSQFGGTLDIVAPSSGGTLGITTTDRMGNSGYNSSNYTLDFGGTSSATPLVAGIAASIIMHNPILTAIQVREVLHAGAEKIGPYAYSDGRNNYYGYGRANLFNSLTACPDNDNDGYSICQNDCNDQSGVTHPGAPEICDNQDNNCNGFIDDNITRQTTCGIGDCSGNTGTETCTAGTWGGDTCDPFSGATAEVCDNLDNNCDGFVDENVTRQSTCGIGVCSGNTGIETCTAGTWGEDTCDPFAGATVEVCDNLDNNCDGQTDEDLQYQLYALVTPTGTGVVNPDCSGACSYDCQDSVVLNAIEENGYPFLNWVLCDAPAGKSCTMTLDNNKNLIAEFSSCKFPARITGSNLEYFYYIQNSVNGVMDGDLLQSQNNLFVEDVIFNNTAAIILEAGYDCNYSSSTGITTISGNMIIQNGAVTIQKGTLEIQ